VILESSVNALTVENTGKDEVFVQAGDIVKGGQQDRVLSVDLLLPPRSGEVTIAAFCVEHGRWHSASHAFSSGESAYHSLRSEKYTQVRDSLRRSGGHTSVVMSVHADAHGNGWLGVMEQNASPHGYARLPMRDGEVLRNYGGPILGWLSPAAYP